MLDRLPRDLIRYLFFSIASNSNLPDIKANLELANSILPLTQTCKAVRDVWLSIRLSPKTYEVFLRTLMGDMFELASELVEVEALREQERQERSRENEAVLQRKGETGPRVCESKDVDSDMFAAVAVDDNYSDSDFNSSRLEVLQQTLHLHLLILRWTVIEGQYPTIHGKSYCKALYIYAIHGYKDPESSNLDILPASIPASFESTYPADSLSKDYDCSEAFVLLGTGLKAFQAKFYAYVHRSLRYLKLNSDDEWLEIVDSLGQFLDYRVPGYWKLIGRLKGVWSTDAPIPSQTSSSAGVLVLPVDGIVGNHQQTREGRQLKWRLWCETSSLLSMAIFVRWGLASRRLSWLTATSLMAGAKNSTNEMLGMEMGQRWVERWEDLGGEAGTWWKEGWEEME